ncbi:hypothetical protein BKA69DRAFT_1088437 [Paraphysoderma sedebokerense]|nr:hypothetical protein BKA69DRAFT_1088437 [Paraphysoderma sedebokerense]
MAERLNTFMGVIHPAAAAAAPLSILLTYNSLYLLVCLSIFRLRSSTFLCTVIRLMTATPQRTTILELYNRAQNVNCHSTFSTARSPPNTNGARPSPSDRHIVTSGAERNTGKQNGHGQCTFYMERFKSEWSRPVYLSFETNNLLHGKIQVG